VKKVIFILGPTSAGKTAVAIELAKKINGEIISADSMQIYKGMDIITAKPTITEQKEVKHYLIDVVSPSQEFNVAQYIEAVKEALSEIEKKNKQPVIVGGTGLYVSMLIDGLFAAPQVDEKIRDCLKAKVREQGLAPLYKELEKVDPKAAAKIHPHDEKRIVRALEVYESTNKPISSWQQERCGIVKDFILIGLNRDRSSLYERINNRVRDMFNEGVVSEIETLWKTNQLTSKTALQSLGCKEIIGYLKGEYSLKMAEELLQRNTRHYAKRQLTWFRREKRIQWLDILEEESKNEVVERILTII